MLFPLKFSEIFQVGLMDVPGPMGHWEEVIHRQSRYPNRHSLLVGASR